ncbi:hypothetical protein, partial [Huintestinicola sp.]|uniref:hypothetical protein n=1 Tax=Huintestinicola sp. TaxID=2981661 RepID=UPI003D7ECE9E
TVGEGEVRIFVGFISSPLPLGCPFAYSLTYLSKIKIIYKPKKQTDIFRFIGQIDFPKAL